MSNSIPPTSVPPITLPERFRVDGVLGRGGSSVVYDAFDMRLVRRVAIKAYTGSVNDVDRARLEREARALAAIKSPHVVKILDVIDEAPALVMERLYGSTVEQYIGNATPQHMPSWLCGPLDALSEAHSLSIVHRDVKPANLFLQDDGQVKLLDFGVVSVGRKEPDAMLTATGELLGTPRYMAPEQFENARNIGPASDIWATGITMYELLTGESPFSGQALARYVHSVLFDQPRPRPDRIPGKLEAIIMRCLQKDPNSRFESAYALRVALTSVWQ